MYRANAEPGDWYSSVQGECRARVTGTVVSVQGEYRARVTGTAVSVQGEYSAHVTDTEVNVQSRGPGNGGGVRTDHTWDRSALDSWTCFTRENVAVHVST